MLLYLVQHGEANSKETDVSRSLSEKGTADIKKVAAHAAAMNVSVSRIVHSGKRRAVQSAQILSEHITVRNEVAESDALSPMDDPQIWHERLLKIDEDLILVGHLPFMAKLSGLLLCGSGEKAAVHFEMGCMVCLKRAEDGSWALEWIIKPQMIND